MLQIIKLKFKLFVLNVQQLIEKIKMFAYERTHEIRKKLMFMFILNGYSMENIGLFMQVFILVLISLISMFISVKVIK